jgi:hypothetical protein
MSFNNWEYNNFDHLLNLREIYFKHISQNYPEMANYIMSDQFLLEFSLSLFNNLKNKDPFKFKLSTPSSNHTISESNTERYNQYIIKRKTPYI